MDVIHKQLHTRCVKPTEQEQALDYTSAIDNQRRTAKTEPSRLCYWNPELLSSFTFLMAGHGSPVCASMMLGDAEYAREQLRLACTLDDRTLQQIAVEMLSGFTHHATEHNVLVEWAH
jgi:hypothetical protein